MLKVEILTGIKHAGAQYLSGEVRILEETTARYFVSNGWAKYPGGNLQHVDTSPKTLSIDTAQHGHKTPGVK